MSEASACDRCGVPLMVSSGHSWDPNGVISLADSPHNRMVFFESDIIDQLFRGIEELIGMPIEHMIIEGRSRETKRYIERVFPPEAKKVLEGKGGGIEGAGLGLTPEERDRFMATMRGYNEAVIAIARNLGYGDERLGEGWERGDDYPWRSYIIRGPYSLLFIAADHVGSVEAFEGADMRVSYEQVGEDTYVSNVYPGEHPVELKERLKRRRYEFKPGDITYECCPQCGVPLDVAAFRFETGSGMIWNPYTERRMAFFGPFSIDPIFDDLEAELGEVIPEAVIEAQRRYLKHAWGDEIWRRGATDFQHMIALRGLGNLTLFEGDRQHLTLRIENACLHLPMVGTIQALVELAYNKDSSRVAWELHEDGDLNVTISL